MPTVWASGCSYTYGHGLKDCHVDPNGPGPLPSKYAWPQLVADKLGYDCVNVSKPGLGAKGTWHFLIANQQLFKPDDVLVVMWPDFLSRPDILLCPPLEEKDNMWRCYQAIRYFNQDAKDLYYFKHFHRRYDQFVARQVLIDHLDMFAKKRNLCLVQGIFVYDEWLDEPDYRTDKFIGINDNIPDNPQFYRNGLLNFDSSADVIKYNFAGIAGRNPLALDNAHPGEESHREFAEIYYSEIQKKLNS